MNKNKFIVIIIKLSASFLILFLIILVIYAREYSKGMRCIVEDSDNQGINGCHRGHRD